MRSTIVFSWFSFACVFTLACSDDGETGQNDSSESGADETTGATSETATASQSTTNSASNSASESATLDTGADVTTAGDESSESRGFINPETGGESGGGPMSNGAECDSNEGCDSGYCYIFPGFGGVCSECTTDSDCEMGTCAISQQMGYAVCTMGELGDMCDSDEGCMGELVCTQIVDTGGLFNASFCSTCGPSLPCEGDLICSPVYYEEGFGGHAECVEPGSVPNNSGCPIDEAWQGNDLACESGVCSVAEAFNGAIHLGVCGECHGIEDCELLEMCTPAQANMDGVMGSVCE